MSKDRSLATFLLGFVAALLIVLVVRTGPTPVLADSASGGAAGNYIVVTGSDQTGIGNLYVIESKMKKVLVYQVHSKGLRLFAVRDFTYDLKPEEYNWSGKPISVADMKAFTTLPPDKNKEK